MKEAVKVLNSVSGCFPAREKERERERETQMTQYNWYKVGTFHRKEKV